MDNPLSDKEIETALAGLPGWARRGDRLEKTFEFADFRHAFSFMTRAAFAAEALNHHPDWSNSYNEVAVRLTTHHAGGKITAKDLELARGLEQAR
ncbi:MAG: 4a-hydroxytetrahydrobiopterin dehydratase [Opitutaceae bacterium]